MLVSRLIEGVGQSPEQHCSQRKGQGYLKALKRTVFCHYAKGITLAGVSGSRFVHERAIAKAQQHPNPEPKQAPKESKPAAKPSFVLTVKTRPILNISLKAEKAKMSEVAQELSKTIEDTSVSWTRTSERVGLDRV